MFLKYGIPKHQSCLNTNMLYNDVDEMGEHSFLETSGIVDHSPSLIMNKNHNIYHQLYCHTPS